METPNILIGKKTFELLFKVGKINYIKSNCNTLIQK